MEATDVLPFAGWRVDAPEGATEPFSGVPLIRARVLAITDRCWACRAKVRGVVGVLIQMSGADRFAPFTEVAETLASAVDARLLAARGIGPLRHRDSPGIPGGYVSNGCVQCDALIGRILLDDLLDEHLRDGGTYGQLDTGLAVTLRIPGILSLLRRGA
jgi:hypothetical protein